MPASVIPSTRAAFVIYKDEPTSTRPKSKSSSTSATAHSLSRTSSSSSLSLSENAQQEPVRITIVTAGDKENVDPITGRRPCLEDTFAKKRKPTPGNVLATKILISKSKVLKDTVPELKKRKVLASSSSSGLSSSSLSNSRGKSKSSSSVTGSGSGEKKERKRRSAKVKTSVQKAPLDLSRVIEEDEDQVDEKEVIVLLAQESASSSSVSHRNVDTEPRKAEEERVAQAQADSRCYELTVLPLADVSTAYCQSHSSDDVRDAREVMTSLDEEIVAAGEKLKTLFTIAKTEGSSVPASQTSKKEQLAPTEDPSPDAPTTLPSTPKSKSSSSTLASTPSSDLSDSPTRTLSLISSLTSASTPTRTPPLRRTLFPSFSYSPSSLFTVSANGSPSKNPLHTPTSSVSSIASNSSTPPTTTFSTPERARIYSAFTFSSPSLAGRRYAVSRGSAVSGLARIGDGASAFSEGGVFGVSSTSSKGHGKVFDDLDW
ncbi:hypothetical protein QCA50_020878 [Cerrena zonata]|uniref:Uncharacterized protein n=1 Tax=Cerrena zonata TaxID=2478898 RepID=A0AAW0FFZ8_9APHY